jgi:hypothetical protein
MEAVREERREGETIAQTQRSLQVVKNCQSESPNSMKQVPSFQITEIEY